MKRDITLDLVPFHQLTGFKPARIVKTGLFLIVFFIITNDNLYSQSFIEKAGGIKTTFTIISESKEVEVLAQAIFKRAFHEADNFFGIDGVYGIGYASQSFRLEFLTTAELNETSIYKKGSRKKYYQIELIDKDDKTLLTSKMGYDEIIKYTNEGDLVTYSINLNEIPMILMERAEKIVIDRVKTYR